MEVILEELLRQVAEGRISPEQGAKRLSYLPFTDLGFAKVDNQRLFRCGRAEVIFCTGKTPSQTGEIASQIAKTSGSLLATKATKNHYLAIKKALPSAVFHSQAKLVTVARSSKRLKGKILVITAGTSDIPVAEEALIVAKFYGSRVERIYDVGVAGLHRIAAYQEQLREAKSIIVCAGMEGALPSLVAGLVKVPVVAVPTSVGYGANFGGISALLTMMNACAPGIGVVNIDNGFGAGYLAHLINTAGEQ
jgi:hypothetical protein